MDRVPLERAALRKLVADEVLARIRTLREAKRTPTDLRALDLLEAMIERQSSEVPNQPGPHANLLKQLAEGLIALKSALDEVGRWDSTLVMTYAEFGRRPRENQSQGTDHGTAAPHFVFGGRVSGGFYGQPPALARLDGNGNLSHAVDFRQMYATVLERWWRLPSSQVLGGRYAPLEFVRL